MTVLVSEQIVDWLKHAFITKFNHIRPSVYERYIDVLCLDLANGSAVGRRGARKVRTFSLLYQVLVELTPWNAFSIRMSTNLPSSPDVSASPPSHLLSLPPLLAHKLLALLWTPVSS